MDAQQIRQIIEADEEGWYAHWGLRGLYDDEQYKAGDTPRESYDWDHTEDCSTYFLDGRTVGGVCTLGIREDDDIDAALNKLYRTYGDGRYALIKGASQMGGEDTGESIITCDARVVAVWED